MTWDEIPLDRPFKMYRLIHDTLGCQMDADPDLEAVTQTKWRLAWSGIETHIVHGWVMLADACAPD